MGYRAYPVCQNGHIGVNEWIQVCPVRHMGLGVTRGSKVTHQYPLPWVINNPPVSPALALRVAWPTPGTDGHVSERGRPATKGPVAATRLEPI